MTAAGTPRGQRPYDARVATPAEIRRARNGYVAAGGDA